jgi:hypothetical protein
MYTSVVLQWELCLQLQCLIFLKLKHGLYLDQCVIVYGKVNSRMGAFPKQGAYSKVSSSLAYQFSNVLTYGC